MARWREQAVHAGVSFAAWIRGRLNEPDDPGPADPPRQTSDVSPGEPGAAAESRASGGASTTAAKPGRARSAVKVCPRARFHRPGSFCKDCGDT